MKPPSDSSGLTPEQYAAAKEVFLAACQRTEEQREAFLDEACTGKPWLREEVENLLSFDASASELHRENESIRPLSPGPTQEVPRHIGRYRILDVIGEGGMGVVFEAEQDNPSRRVAVKVLRPGFATAEVLGRFKHEAEVLGRLQHPGIAQVFEAGTDETAHGSQHFFAMEKIEGQTLLENVARRRPGIRDRLRLFVDICQAVHHAHQKGVIHRDLKPGNIMVDGSGQPKILDFGIARVIDADLETVARPTVEGELIGTFAYMSPEQAAGDMRNLDTRSDVYSLGVILYELLGGTLPVDLSGLTLLEAVRRVRDQDPPLLGTLDRAFRGDLEVIAAKALEKDAADRYQSASGLAEDVLRYLNDTPVMAHPPTTLYQLRKFARRNRVLVGGVASTMLAMLLGMIGMLFLKEEADVKAKEATENWSKARDNLRGFHRMADVKLLQELEEVAAKELWPAWPEKIASMEQWLESAASLEARLASHEGFVRELTERLPAENVGGPASPSWTEQDLVSAWQLEVVEEFVADLRTFVASDPAVGAVASVRRRLDSAKTLHQRSIADFEEEWDAACFGISESETYGGLEIEPQIGLVPLGEDLDSGLWEFWHVDSGLRPEWDSEGNLVIEEDTGVVLVLIPAGEFWMGSQQTDPRGPNYDPGRPNNDVQGGTTDGVELLHQVRLAPYFLSKFELTQSQWLRTAGSNPSYWTPGRWGAGSDSDLTSPVESVSWIDCSAVLHRMGLAIPTEAQWENACRAGTGTPWWTGEEMTSLKGKGNIADRTFNETFTEVKRYEPWLDDLAGVTAAVGRFDPNRFGLHDMSGNVWEWVEDWYGDYDPGTVREGDGLHVIEIRKTRERTLRGGSFYEPAVSARSSSRHHVTPEYLNHDLGVRPARCIDP